MVPLNDCGEVNKPSKPVFLTLAVQEPDAGSATTSRSRWPVRPSRLSVLTSGRDTPPGAVSRSARSFVLIIGPHAICTEASSAFCGTDNEILVLDCTVPENSCGGSLMKWDWFSPIVARYIPM